jgi:hypothetical protein
MEMLAHLKILAAALVSLLPGPEVIPLSTSRYLPLSEIQTVSSSLLDGLNFKGASRQLPLLS